MQRRSFLYNIFLLTGGLMAGCSKRLHLSDTANGTIKGKVSANGKGLADVVVSDGFSVVRTNKSGYYEMPATKGAEHVFVSTPAGYAFPHQNNIARQYKEATVSTELDFFLNPLNVNDDRHQFVIWADPQVRVQSDADKMLAQAVPDMQQFMRSLPAGTLIHGIGVGDIAWDNLEFFDTYNKAVEQCGLPFFQVLGNHDMDYRKGGDETSDDTFKKTYGPTYYSFNRGQVHYVVLDDVWYLGKERDYKGFISTEQLDWLKKDLAFISKEKLVVLCAHIPVHKVENKQALYDILQPYQVHIMTGHTHYNNNIITGNIYEHVHGTVCGAWWSGPVCGDGTPPGYGVYEVNGTDIQWHYKSFGYDKSYQVRASVETNSNGQKQLVANVWNWDPQWKVEWLVDGASKGALPRLEDFDPLAFGLYNGAQLPNPRGWIEPKETEHLFKAVLPQGAQQVKVIATDRFGNRYETVA